MQSRIFFVAIFIIVVLLIDVYVFQAAKHQLSNSNQLLRKIVFSGYWFVTCILLVTVFTYLLGWHQHFNKTLITFIRAGLIIFYFSKFFVLLFLIIDDLIRAARWIYQKIAYLFNPDISGQNNNKITRSDFLISAGLVAAAIPLTAMSWGIATGAYDYRIRRKTLKLTNLPRSFDGLKIVQLSDIHSGSFYNKTAVQGGVEMALAEKPDLIFFTGDLVNYAADEMNDYISVFNKVKAPLGVYSIFGNHDYGDYYRWPSQQAKFQNLEDLKKIHKILGWDLLLNENRKIKINNEQIGVIGIENWSAIGNFQKYGKIDEAMKGTEESAIKLLLSHDPSQWEAQVLKDYPDIDVTFAGHTHGMQFGVEFGNFRWSPVQYIYKQWADLYQSGNQYLYVNRGYGFIGFPGRVGILPEISVFELKSA